MLVFHGVINSKARGRRVEVEQSEVNSLSRVNGHEVGAGSHAVSHLLSHPTIKNEKFENEKEKKT